jgi:phage head maturation protease
MTCHRNIVPFPTPLPDADCTTFIACTGKLARDGHVIDPSGMDVSAFLSGGTVLFDHDPSKPVATPVAARLNTDGDLEVTAAWPPPGTSKHADECRALVKTGVIRSVSVGYTALEAVPLDATNPRGGKRVTQSELLECSFVAVPADVNALITQRSGVNMQPPGSIAHHLAEADRHLEAAQEHWADEKHDAMKRRIDLARGCLQRAMETGNLAITNPTAAQGAQASGGFSGGETDRAARRRADIAALRRVGESYSVSAETIARRRREIATLAAVRYY